MTDDEARGALDAWRGGDLAAGDALLQVYFPLLARMFNARMPHRAADLIQRTMLAAVEAKGRIPEGVPFRAYLLGIARRILVGEYREADREARRRELDDYDALVRTSPSEAIARRQQQRVLLSALRELPLDLQLAVELHYWEDLGMEEVAAVLDVPVGTAKSRLRRAKELLVDGVQRESGSLVVTQDDLGGWAHELRWFLERTGSPRG
jgi:RNA polymerase sigma factor (sigma-70 family)